MTGTPSTGITTFPLRILGYYLITLTSQDTDKGRIKRWIETMVKAGLFQKGDSTLSYDRDLWLKEAFKNYEKEEFNKRKVVGALLADNFATSNWYQYYLAVRWYKERFFAICKEQGVAIPGKVGDVVEFVDFCGGGSNLFLLKRKIGKTRFICQESWLFRP